MGSDFMRQFMAGWQMGQSRNENTRRDQDMMLAQQQEQRRAQQDAIDNQMRQEHWKLQKQQADLEYKRAQFDAKAQAAAMTSRQAQVLPPETQDLGGGTTLNLGEMTAPRAPMTAAIPAAPEGTPEVQLPFKEDIEEQQQAERQQKMRELLGLERGKLAVKQEFEPAPEDNPAAWKQQGDGTYVNVLSGAVRGRPDPTGVGGGGGGITPNQEAALVDKLGKNWQALSKDVTTMRRQASMMDSGLAAAKRGDLAAGSQAVLVTFQKILDPTSVVRESEYARSAAGQALLARIEGAFDQVQRGGAGVPVSELEKFAALAKEFIAKSESGLQGERTRIGKIADRYKIPKDLIFSDETVSPGGGAAPAGDYEATAVPGVRRRKVQR